MGEQDERAGEMTAWFQNSHACFFARDFDLVGGGRDEDLLGGREAGKPAAVFGGEVDGAAEGRSPEEVGGVVVWVGYYNRFQSS